MTKNGHNVEIITPHEITENKEIDNIVVHCIGTKGPLGFTALKILRKALQKKYDLFYCHELDPLVYSWILKKITKTPIIWDCHEYLVPMKRELQGNFSALLTKIAINFAAPKTDHIITVDNTLGKQLSRFGPVTVIPNYPTILDFPLSKPKYLNLLRHNSRKKSYVEISLSKPSSLRYFGSILKLGRRTPWRGRLRR